MGKRPLVTPTRHAPLAAEAQIAIIGGGIMGLGLAYHLASLGQTNIVVLEAHHLAWGASGRNGGGVRQQWSTDLNIRLMQESVELCKGFASTMGQNIWMRQGGYLFLARSPDILPRMEAAVRLQNQCDVPTRFIDTAEAKQICPELDEGQFSGACFNPTDAIVFPWPFLWGYAQAAAKKGVQIHTFTPVQKIDRSGDGFELLTSKGRLRARRVINAAGAWSAKVAKLLPDAPSLPTWPERHEILSTEACRPFLRPMVSVLDTGLYVSQSLRGEVVGGLGISETRQDEAQLGSSLRFVEDMAHGLLQIMPRLGHLKVVRQWAGPYDRSPDGDPLVGQMPGIPGLYVCCGFVGHGFMMAPVVTRYLAMHLMGISTHPLFTAWDPARFAKGAGTGGAKEHMNIG